jgi:hypothetical protein
MTTLSTPPVVLPRWRTANSARGEGQTTGVVGTREITDTELPRMLVIGEGAILA